MLKGHLSVKNFRGKWPKVYQNIRSVLEVLPDPGRGGDGEPTERREAYREGHWMHRMTVAEQGELAYGLHTTVEHI